MMNEYPHGIEQRYVTERRLGQWGDSVDTQPQGSPGQTSSLVINDLVHLQFEQPVVITLEVFYSTPRTALNDTRVIVQYGTGKILKQVEIGEGVSTFPCQNIQVTVVRLDHFALNAIHPPCKVEVLAVESPGAIIGYTPLALVP
jgi:hypothetical protein